MPLRLELLKQTNIPVEVPGIVPQSLRALPLAQIERLPIQHGNQSIPLAELFAVAGSAADETLCFAGELAGVHGIGSGMSAGTIHVEGNAGRHVGSEMTGGTIHVSGNAGDWVGAEMHDGLIHVRGDAGHLVGSAYRGSRRGMTGGTILIGGNVGDEVGHTMRRGLLAIGGSCGNFVGINMIAGSIFVRGPVGERAGAGMRRGTIGLFHDRAPRLLPTFRPGGCDRPLYLELMLRHLRALGFGLDDALFQGAYRTYHGDQLAGGRGELLVPERAA